jgi:hypothetical protein
MKRLPNLKAAQKLTSITQLLIDDAEVCRATFGEFLIYNILFLCNFVQVKIAHDLEFENNSLTYDEKLNGSRANKVCEKKNWGVIPLSALAPLNELYSRIQNV